ncbi:MAG: Dolichyl-phosphate-mannose-protein mannosyltransferase, partial [Lacunisphaera sp.]|nr:Dolichyl-phosphate-mannose-protein mannosyltransferase [Lacunisphaera sp.]
FAVVAAGTREYGPVFAVAAVVAAKLMQLPRRRVLLLALIALPVAFAWPLRVWLRTGNPLYSLDLLGLFPVNPVFTAWNDGLRAPHAGVGWSGLGRYFLLWALPAVAGVVALGALLVERLREARLVAGFVALVFALWLASVAYTAGGLFYSLRVLAPACALLMVVASYGAGYFIRHAEAAKYLALGVGLLSLEALPKTLLLPENPYQVAVRDWPAAGGQFPATVRAQEEELIAKLTPLPGRRQVLSDLAALPRRLAAINTEVLPLWSPEVAWLFDGSVKPEEVARRWQQSGLRYVVIAKSGPTPDFFRTHARWRAPYFTLKPVAETASAIILEAVVATLPAPAAR